MPTLLLLLVSGLLRVGAASPELAVEPRQLSIADLERVLAEARTQTLSFRLEGVVRAVVPSMHLVAVQDITGTALIRLPDLDAGFSVGEWVAVEGSPGIVDRTVYGVEIRSVPLVDNDGLHSPVEMTASLSLAQGRHPIQVEWFNGPTERSLILELEGPDTPRQTVPASWLCQVPEGAASDEGVQPGLHYEAYEASRMADLGDLRSQVPVREGLATNISIVYRTRDELCGLAFRGFLRISRSGVYTFHLTSDDGSRLYLGAPSVVCRRIPTREMSLPAVETLEQALEDRGSLHWIEMEGEVAFVSEDQRSLHLELLAGGNRVRVRVIDGRPLFATNLLHRWVKVTGVSRFSADARRKRLVGVFVPGAAQVQVLEVGAPGYEAAAKGAGVLTTAAQVRGLRPAEAARHVRARLRGVVIFASSTAVVLRDWSGGVFISWNAGTWKEQPKVGEFWEIEGATDPGMFSPVIVAEEAGFLGYAPMPDPVQPTRDQLMNGNMDAEYGELRGVITSVTEQEISLLTPEGNVTVVGNAERPLPYLPQSDSRDGGLVGSVVLIRGCFAPSVNVATRQVAPGRIFIFPALVQVEDAAPRDPFQLPARAVADLMWFDARASALLRTKLKGQVLYAASGEYFVRDEHTGFRVRARNELPLVAGDLIEAVGFPKLDGPSPVLLEALVRKTGHAPLPSPTPILAEGLLDRRLDATLVEVEATLIRDSIQHGGRVLELESGPRQYSAHLKPGSSPHDTLPSRSRLRVVGVYACADGSSGAPLATAGSFELLLNGPADFVVMERPPWWTIRRIFMVLMAVCGVLGVMFVWVASLRRQVAQRTVQLRSEIEQRQQVEQRHAIEKERTRLARDLHDELGAGLTEVGMLGSLANASTASPDAKGRYLAQLTSVAHSLVASLDEIVWAVNPDYDTVNSLVSYLSLYAESFLSMAGIQCRLRVMDAALELPMDSKARHGVFCAFKEALNNAVRHSGATEIQLAFEVDGGMLSLSVTDNGRGFVPKPEATGRDGLEGLRKRMQSLGGECRITSGPGKGTNVLMRLPVHKVQNG